MNNKPYYMAYENRYQKVYEAGAELWGHSPDDKDLVSVLTTWVNINQLKGKRVIEFACGEGAPGIILSKLGCIYNGVDIAPSAVEKARNILMNYPNVTISLLDMVNEKIDGVYDAGLDVMGLHMLVTDSDRTAYLKNAFNCLKEGAPMLFYRENYRIDAYEGQVTSFNDWLSLFPGDYKTPQKRSAKHDGKDTEVYIPLLPARPKTREGYIREMERIGFIVDVIQEIDINNQIIYSVSINVHKP